MSNKEQKEKYTKLFNIVKKIINEWDPIGLIPSAPDDEYEFEILRIVTLLNKVDSEDALSAGIATIFTKAFGWSFTKEECFSVAQKIWRETKI